VLAAGSVEGVAGSIKELVATNTKRKDIQKAIIAQATDMAEDLLAAHPDCKVLLLASEGWEPGVVGIVAARIKEKFFRPTFVCGMNDGFWKGSGRSVEGYDLGALVHRAMDAKVIMGGGGHAMAAGISFTKEQLLPFMNWIEEATTDIQLDFTKTYEVLGNAELFSVNDWLKLYQRLEPYGQANRRCALLLDNVTLVGGPDEMTKNSDGSVWALKAKFATDAGATFSVTWGDLDRAASLWSAGSKYRMVVSLSKSEGKGGRTYENWRVDDCEQVD
jgi:single-stranded-DNA-specific exonuclease